MTVLSHKEWFRPVLRRQSKSCPTCHCKLSANESIWSWGEYACYQWYTLKYFCKRCYETEVIQPLFQHAKKSGCTLTCVYIDRQPEWSYTTITAQEVI